MSVAAKTEPLVSKLKFAITPTHRRMKNPRGPEGRIDRLRKTVTALLEHERIELFSNRADEARGYAERLISEAIRHGDAHGPTMELADFWLLRKELVHKLFKVLVPRFENCEVSYTRMHKAPRPPNTDASRAVLELRGNPFPPLKPKQNDRLYIHNVLLDAAKFEYRREKRDLPDETPPTEAVRSRLPEEMS